VILPTIRYGKKRFRVPWAQSWAVPLIYLIQRIEDATYGFGWVLARSRIRLLIYLGVTLHIDLW
jgi:hypothetical protein